MKYKIVYADPSYSNSTLEALIEQCNTSDDIHVLLGQNLFTIERLEMPCGSLRKEHVEKAVQIALYFGAVQVLPDIPLLRKLCSKIVPPAGKEIQISNKQVVQYFKDTYPDIKLNDAQWKQVAGKLSIEDLLSIDRMAERAVLVWNSIPGMYTTNSCTGHADAPRYFCFSNLNISYNPSQIQESILNDTFRKDFDDFNSDIMKTDLRLSDNRIDIMFFQIPSHDWIKRHNSVSVEALTQECYDQLVSVFNTNSDLDDFEKEKKVSTIRAVDFIRRKLFRYFNKLNTTFEIDDDEDELYWGIFRKRCLIFEETYKEFYLSPEAIGNIKRFWKCCEELVPEIRNIVS